MVTYLCTYCEKEISHGHETGTEEIMIMKKWIKKGLLTVSAIGISILGVKMTGLTAEAAEVVCEAEKVEANEDGTYTVAFELDSDYGFAGGEFAIECQEGVSVTDVSYDVLTSAVAPTEARGYTWFGFFAGSNEYSEPVSVTMTVASEEGVEAPYVTISEARVYTSSNGQYGTEVVDVDKQVLLGADAVLPVEDGAQPATVIADEEVALAGGLTENTLPSKNNMMIVIACGVGMLLVGGVFLYIQSKKKVRK